jgi:hypothetical protein
MKKEWKPVAWDDIRAGDVVRKPAVQLVGDLVDHIGSMWLYTADRELICRYIWKVCEDHGPVSNFQRLEQVEEAPQDCPFCGESAYVTEGDRFGFLATCSDTMWCGHTGPLQKTEQYAIAAWNRIQLKPEVE